MLNYYQSLRAAEAACIRWVLAGIGRSESEHLGVTPQVTELLDAYRVEVRVVSAAMEPRT